MKSFILKLAFAFAVSGAALCINMRVSHADQQGNSRWCHVENKGDVLSWDCDYDTIDECQPVIVTSGGWCTINPDWHPEPSSNGH